MIHDDRQCELGEGALWHPQRNQLFWFDILGRRLLSRDADGPRAWDFSERVSAAGWIDADRLLIASETALFRFDLATGTRAPVAALEADNPGTRSNDGRADPQGGFWIGTMGLNAEAGAGAIWRLAGGELRRLFPGLTIPNAICFPAPRLAQFVDTRDRRVMRVALDADGWPSAAPEVWLDLTGAPGGPDGAIVDAEGVTWIALWGAGRVAGYAPDGSLVREVPVPAPHATCPALGPDGTLYVTSALEGMAAGARATHPQAGMTFAVLGVARSRPEPRVIV